MREQVQLRSQAQQCVQKTGVADQDLGGLDLSPGEVRVPGPEDPDQEERLQKVEVVTQGTLYLENPNPISGFSR